MVNGTPDIGAFEGTSQIPFATTTLANVPPAGADYVVTVVYEDETGINVGSIDPSDLQLAGPGFGTPPAAAISRLPSAVSASGTGTA